MHFYWHTLYEPWRRLLSISPFSSAKRFVDLPFRPFNKRRIILNCMNATLSCILLYHVYIMLCHWSIISLVSLIFWSTGLILQTCRQNHLQLMHPHNTIPVQKIYIFIKYLRLCDLLSSCCIAESDRTSSKNKTKQNTLRGLIGLHFFFFFFFW